MRRYSVSYPLPFKSGDEVVELGGGSNPIIKRVPGLKSVNVDVRELPDVDIVRNLEEDFSDLGSFDGILAHYVAEHISWKKVTQFFKNCYQILKPGGIALFVVPDTYGQMQKILEKTPEEINLDDSCFLFGGQGCPEDAHKVLFSKPLITKLLKGAGFNDVKITDCFDPNVPDARDMVVEARRKAEKPTILVGAIADVDTKINFGSFTVTFGDAWINADIRGDIKQAVEDKGHLFEFCDVTKPVRWEDNSVSLVTAHHLIEHLSREEGSFFLRECFRILKPGGVIRLSTPDLDTFIDHHKAGDFRKTYVKEFEVKYAEDDVDAFFRLAFKGHKTIYTYPSLREKMEDAKFTEVKKMPYGASRSDAIMTETEDSFPDHSFYIEAEKGRGCETLEMTERDGIKIWYRDIDGRGSADLSILNDLLIRGAQAKEVFSLPQNSVVVDLGAHIGVYSLFVKSRRPDLRIYAVEPLPENVDILRKNISENELDIEVLPFALSDIAGERDMWVHDFNAGANTLSEGEMKCHSLEYHSQIKVQCITLADLLERIKEEHIDLMKVDIQGEEYPLMKYLLDNPEIMSKIGSLDMEFHPLDDHYALANPLVLRLQKEGGFTMRQTGRDTAYFHRKPKPQSSAQTAKPLEDYQKYLSGEDT